MTLQIVDFRLQINWGIEEFATGTSAASKRRAIFSSLRWLTPCRPEGMTQQAEDLKTRTKQFALDVIRFVRTLASTDEARSIGRQLLRSGPGVASNYRSACRARSRAEFVARIGVALEEADESALWFEILTESAISRTRRRFDCSRNPMSSVQSSPRPVLPPRLR